MTTSEEINSYIEYYGRMLYAMPDDNLKGKGKRGSGGHGPKITKGRIDAYLDCQDNGSEYEFQEFPKVVIHNGKEYIASSRDHENQILEGNI